MSFSEAYIEKFESKQKPEFFSNIWSYDSEETETIRKNGSLYRARPDFSPDFIVGLAFGSDWTEDSYNAELAGAVEDAVEIFGEDPKVKVQTEIYSNLDEVDAEAYGKLNKGNKTHEEMSYDILERFSDDISGENVLLVAHPGHVQRCEWLAENMGAKETSVFTPAETNWLNEDRQLWGRNPVSWALWETAARTHHKLKGWI